MSDHYEMTQPQEKPVTTVQEFLKLVDDYGNACLRAGQSNSGFMLSPSAGFDWEKMQKLRKKLIDFSKILEADKQ